MKMFSDCSGECCVCWIGNHSCLAGHGDDHFSLASKEKIIERIKNKEYPDWHDYMKNVLRDKYGYNYD